MRIFKYLFICFLMAFLSLGVAAAQTITAAVTGTVTDPSGAVVSGAQVTATNTATSVSYPGTTNNEGVYYIRFLPIGTYTLTINTPGFKVVQLKPFTLAADQQARFDETLATGGASEVVTVTDTQPLINTQDASISTTFDEKQVKELPMVGDNILSLGLLIPGSVDTNTLDNIPPPGTTASTSNRSFNLNGNVGQATIIILDGQQVSSIVNDSLDYNANREAIQEFKIITNNATAEYGNANGGTILITTKGGTNQFHGGAWGQVQATPFNANTWANKRNKALSPPTNPALAAADSTPSLSRTYFGGQFGGPIRKDKLFFFVAYKGIRYHGTKASTWTVPDTMYGGIPGQDMTGGLNANPGLENPMAYDPSTNKFWPVLNPVARYFLSHPDLYPVCNECNHTSTGGLTGKLGYNYFGNQKSVIQVDQMDSRVDYRINDKNSVSGRFSYLPIFYAGFSKVPFPADVLANSNYPWVGGVINWDSLLTPNISNEARFAVGRLTNHSLPQDVDGAFGKNGNATAGIPGVQNYPGIAQIQFTGTGPNLSSFGGSGNGLTTESAINTFEFGDDLTWQIGRHSLKMGAQLIRVQNNTFYSGPSGSLGFFTYTGSGNLKTSTLDSVSTGSYWSDFLTDKASNFGQGANTGTWGQRSWRDGLFFQDDWKILPNLTINLGMRWEYDQPWAEVLNRQANVDPFTGVVTVAGANGASRSLVNSFWGGFMPRVGFAYTPETLNNRLSIRGGYAITNFFQGIGATLNIPLNPLFVYNAGPAANSPAPYKVENGFGNGLARTISGKFPIFAHNLQPQLIQQFDLALEYQINSVSSLMVGYVGEDGHHLENVFAGNASPCSAIPVGKPLTPGGVGTGPVCTSPLLNTSTPYNPPATGKLGNEASISSGGLEETASEGAFSYNSLQVQYRRNLSHNLTLVGNYTYDKSLQNGSTSFYPQDPMNLHAEWGPSTWDAKHIASGAAVYQLPIGRGQLIGKNWNAWMDGIFGGWKTSLAASWHTGFPITITSNHWYNATGQTQDFTARANAYRPFHVVHRSAQHWWGTDPSATPCVNSTNLPASDWFNESYAPNGAAKASTYTVYTSNDNGVCAYGDQLTTGFGTASNGTERAPNYKNVDASAGKVFALPRGNAVEFRVDAFNALNLVSLAAPSASTDVGANFGVITSAAGYAPERHLQFTLKYSF